MRQFFSEHAPTFIFLSSIVLTRLQETQSQIGLKSQTALKIRSVYMALSLQPTLRSQTSFKNCSVSMVIYCGNVRSHSEILMGMRKL